MSCRPLVGAVNGRRTPLSRVYESPEQTITPGGTLSLSHGLNGVPAMVQVRLICKTADDGYSVGDVVIVGTNSDLNRNESNPSRGGGCQITVTTTTLDVTYGNYTTGGGPFVINNKVSGTDETANNANWNAIFLAWR